MPIKVIQWDLDAWEDYLYWQSQDKKNLKRINKLLKDISRNPSIVAAEAEIKEVQARAAAKAKAPMREINLDFAIFLHSFHFIFLCSKRV